MSEKEVYDVLREEGPLTHSEISTKLPHISVGGLDRLLEPMVERGELSWEKDEEGNPRYNTRGAI